MTDGRKVLGAVVELAIEALVTGLFWQIGESLVTESLKAAKRRGKKKAAPKRAAHVDNCRCNCHQPEEK